MVGWAVCVALAGVLSRKDPCRSAPFVLRKSRQACLVVASASMAAGSEMQPAPAWTERCQLAKTPLTWGGYAIGLLVPGAPSNLTGLIGTGGLPLPRGERGAPAVSLTSIQRETVHYLDVVLPREQRTLTSNQRVIVRCAGHRTHPGT